MDESLAGLTLDDVRSRPGLERLEEVAVGAIVLRRDGYEVLLLRREADGDVPAAEKVPSGTVDPGETLGDAVRRVARRQAGLEAWSVGEVWFGLSYVSPRGPAVQFDFVTDVGPSPEPSDPPAGWAHRWVARHDLMASDLVRPAAAALTKRLGTAGPP
jgi:8-oxo-dGTP diphosphatase